MEVYVEAVPATVDAGEILESLVEAAQEFTDGFVDGEVTGDSEDNL